MASVLTWKTLSGKHVDDYVAEVVKSTADGNRLIHVGCDSQQHELITEFVRVVVLLKPGKGGRVLWTTEKVPRITSLRERLLTEVSKSIEIGFELNEVLSEDVELCIHIDVNPKLRYKSSKYLQELVGYVTGQGFNVLTKPDSWAAMHVADFCVKHKNIGRYNVGSKTQTR